MAYTKTNWVNGYTPLNASNMNKIEEGIYNNDTFLYSLDIRVNTLEGSIGQGGIGSVVVNGNGNALTNVSYTPSTKILNFEKNNNFALDSELDSVNEKNLYHLGAYDSVSGNVITRQTGYVNVINLINSFTRYQWNDTIFQTIVPLSEIGSLGEETSLSKYILSDNINYTRANVYGAGIPDYTVSIFNDYLSVKNTNNDINVLKQYLLEHPLIIQYKLATSYTEEIIENQPLTTLDQSGSQWIREEWEKGLNLFDKDNPNLVYGIGYEPNPSSSLGTDWVKVAWIPVKPNTTYSVNKNVRYSFYNGGWSDIGPSNVTTFTTASDTQYLMLIEYHGGTQTPDTSKTAWANLMLVGGSHAYPYQEYKGQIVREKELNEKIVKVKEFNAESSTFNNFKNWVDSNREHIISIMFYNISSGSNSVHNVIFGTDGDVYKYINSEGTFDDVSISTSGEGGDILKIYYI